MLYLSVLIILIFFTYYFDYLKNRESRDFFYYLMLIVFILIAGLRYRIGLDTIVYMQDYSWAVPLHELDFSNIFNYKWEPLYKILESTARSISSEFYVLQFMQAIIVNTVFFRFIKKNTPNIFFGIMLYYLILFLPFNTETMREACAVSMVLLGYEYYKKDNIFALMVFIGLAYLFHRGAVVMFIIPIVKLLKIDRILRINSLTVVVLLMICIVGYSIQKILFSQLELIAFTTQLKDKVDSYSESRLATQTVNILGIINLILLKMIVPYFAIVFLKNRDSESCKDIEPFVFLAFVFAVLSIPITLLHRFENYFLPFSLLAISQVAYQDTIFLNKRYYFVSKDFGIWILIFLSPIWIARFNQVFNVKEPGTDKFKSFSRYYPYETILTKNKDDSRELLFKFKGLN